MDEKELKEFKREELLRLAKSKNIKGRTKMKKSELIKALLRFFKKKKKAVPSKQPQKRFIKSRRPEREEVKPALELEKEKVEVAKFEAGREPQPGVGYQPQKPEVAVTEKVEIPQTYGEDRLTLLVRDPWWLYAYWEITPQTWEQTKAGVGAGKSFKEVLRVYDVTDIPEFKLERAHGYFDIELTPFANNWYINVGQPERSYCTEIGLRLPNGEFYPMVRSNIVKTPRYGISPITDEEWMISEEEYWKMFGLSGGYGIGKGSLEMQELFKKRFEELVSSGFPGSAFSWFQREEIPKGFWLIADAELVIYGATERDAKLTVQGKPVKLREDGTFSLRFAFPDGIQEIPIIATSGDGRERKEIKITVERETAEGD